MLPSHLLNQVFMKFKFTDPHPTAILGGLINNLRIDPITSVIIKPDVISIPTLSKILIAITILFVSCKIISN